LQVLDEVQYVRAVRVGDAYHAWKFDESCLDSAMVTAISGDDYVLPKCLLAIYDERVSVFLVRLNWLGQQLAG
jgi:hypothetical protein